jgi:hypothetical protein
MGRKIRHGQRTGGEQPTQAAGDAQAPSPVAGEDADGDPGPDRDPAEAALETEDDAPGADAGDLGGGPGDDGADASAVPPGEGAEDEADGDDPAGDADLEDIHDAVGVPRPDPGEVNGGWGDDAIDEDDPELAAVEPVLTIDLVKHLAYRCADDVTNELADAAESLDAPPAIDPALASAFDLGRKTKWSAPVEALYRQMRTVDKTIPPWDQRNEHLVQFLRIFAGMARALGEIADEQQAAYDAVAARLDAEAKAGKRRRIEAGKREKKKAKRDRRKAAMAKATLQRRADRMRAERDAAKGKA